MACTPQNWKIRDFSHLGMDTPRVSGVIPHPPAWFISQSWGISISPLRYSTPRSRIFSTSPTKHTSSQPFKPFLIPTTPHSLFIPNFNKSSRVKLASITKSSNQILAKSPEISGWKRSITSWWFSFIHSLYHTTLICTIHFTDVQMRTRGEEPQEGLEPQHARRHEAAPPRALHVTPRDASLELPTAGRD